MPFTEETPRLIVEGSFAYLDDAVEYQLAQLEREIDAALVMGTSASGVDAWLAGSRETILRDIAGRVAHDVRNALGQMSFASYWEETMFESQWWRWTVEPTAKHCDTCLHRENRVGTRQQFEAVGLPRAGTTDCDGYCRCHLLPISENEYRTARGRGLTIGRGHAGIG